MIALIIGIIYLEIRLYYHRKLIKENIDYSDKFVTHVMNHIIIMENHIDGLQNSMEEQINGLIETTNELIKRPEINRSELKISLDLTEEEIIEKLDKALTIPVKLGYFELDLDTILDKISEKGIESLTKEEKEFLDKKKDQI